MSIECYVPLRLQLSGELSADDWSALEDALMAHYARALRRGTNLSAAGGPAGGNRVSWDGMPQPGPNGRRPG
jgi:hypothetical protein